MNSNFSPILMDQVPPLAPIQTEPQDNGQVFGKIDWLTVMFFDCSILDVLRWIKLESCVQEFLEDSFESSRGYDQVLKFFFNGIFVETSSFNFYGSQDDLAVFDVICPKIRLELSATALDYLRSIGVNMDTYRFHAPVLPDGGSYHFTRCDFAFDFVNYQPFFMDQLINFVRSNALPSGRVPLASSRGAVLCKVVDVSEKTVYLGSPQSDRMLRCYDKRLQYIDPRTGSYVKPNPFNNPDSWFRIEMQTRNKVAHSLVLDDNLQFLHVLKLIFEKYAFADANIDSKHSARPVVDFWGDLLPWIDIETKYVQNANLVEFREAEDRVLDHFFKAGVRSFLMALTILGQEEFDKRVTAYINSLYDDDPVQHRRLLNFICKLNELQNTNIPVLNLSEFHHSKNSGLVLCGGRLWYKRM